MKIGIIGLGDIAQKAYLPVMAGKGVEVHLYSRNRSKLAEISEKYRFPNLHHSLQSLIDSGISGAFVHTSTASHEEIVVRLLENNIHVYVDKPVTYDFPSTEKLVQFATHKKLLLMVGFNRRYAPAYQKLKEMQDVNMVVMQKNRKSLPGDVRTFVFDDFIHVIDTLLHLFPFPLDHVQIDGKKKEGLLHHVVVHLTASKGTSAIGIMNRDSGTVEERLEVFTPEEKRVVLNLTQAESHSNKGEIHSGGNDWDGTLFKRGFRTIIDEFLSALTTQEPHLLQPEILRTHRLCEDIVLKIECPFLSTDRCPFYKKSPDPHVN